MPFITETQAAAINRTVANANNKLAQAKARAEEKAGEIKDGMEVIGAATLMGYARGAFEAKGSSFVVPGTSIDIELLAGVGLVGLGMADVLGKYDNDALMTGYGCLAHYMGQLGRNYGKSGTVSAVAGLVGADPLDSLLSGAHI